MDIRTLRHFVAVVQEEGISAAADVLRMSQPALSRQMKELENELGVTLFERGNRGRSISLKGACSTGVHGRSSNSPTVRAPKCICTTRSPAPYTSRRRKAI